jgi:hypothetical protein
VSAIFENVFAIFRKVFGTLAIEPLTPANIREGFGQIIPQFPQDPMVSWVVIVAPAVEICQCPLANNETVKRSYVVCVHGLGVLFCQFRP